MVKKRTLAKTAAVTFGAALTTMYAAPDLHAGIVPINFIPGSLPFSPGASTNVLMSTTGGAIGTFSQWNDGIGKTLNFNTGGLLSWRSAALSSTLNAATFTGFAGNIGFTTGASGTIYIGFRSVAGNVGWFGMNLGGTGGPIVWGVGAGGGSEYGNLGESVHVGGTAQIPEPASAGLAALAEDLCLSADRWNHTPSPAA